MLNQIKGWDNSKLTLLAKQLIRTRILKIAKFSEGLPKTPIALIIRILERAIPRIKTYL
jgi:hypothetical protein